MRMEIESRNERPPRRWTRQEYERLVELGVFEDDERLELIDGEILVMSPQGTRHASLVAAAIVALQRAFGPGFHVRPQCPFAASDLSEPEPDLHVVRGEPLDYRHRHPEPSDTLLVLEVSDTSRRFDLGRKASLYARAGVPEYWVLDLDEETLVVHRDPGAERYGAVSPYDRSRSVQPLGAGEAMAVAALL